jgi:hypothetical protein
MFEKISPTVRHRIDDGDTAPVAPPLKSEPRMREASLKRLSLIDGLRGYFLVGMFLQHVPGTQLLLWANHSRVSFVEDAQGFIFLSGLLVGLLYGTRMMRCGFAGEAWSLWRRAAKLYAWAVGCVLVVLLMREILPGAPEAWSTSRLNPLGEGRVGFIVATALLLYEVRYLAILTQYFVYFLVVPPLLWLCLTKRWLLVTSGSLILWFTVQIGVFRPLAEVINYGLSTLDPKLTFHVYFNLLAWQLVFFGGMVIGALWAQGKIKFDRVFDPHKTLLFRICVVSLLFFLLLRLGVNEETGELGEYSNRREFSLIYLVNFVLLAYVVAWLLIAGPRSKHKAVASIGRGLSWFFGLSFLQLLGRHSLLVYAWHVVLYYFIVWYNFSHGPSGEMRATAIALCGVVLLALPAVLQAFMKATLTDQTSRTGSNSTNVLSQRGVEGAERLAAAVAGQDG